MLGDIFVFIEIFRQDRMHAPKEPGFWKGFLICLVVMAAMAAGIYFWIKS